MADKKSVPSFGEVLTKRFLEPNGISQYQLAKAIGKAPTAVNRVISGKVGLSPEMAALIGKALGTGAEYWIDVDAAYQLSKVEDKEVTVLLEGNVAEDGSLVESGGYTFSTRTINDAALGRAVRGAYMAASHIIGDGTEGLFNSINDYLMYHIINSPSTNEYVGYYDDMPNAAIAIFEQFLICAGENPDEVRSVIDDQRIQTWNEIGTYDYDGFERPANARLANKVRLSFVGELMCAASQLGQDVCNSVMDCLFAYAHDELITFPEDDDARKVFKDFLWRCGEHRDRVDELEKIWMEREEEEE